MMVRSQELRNQVGNIMDTIANALIQIKNAGDAGKKTVSVPFSKLKMAILDLLVKEGYVESAVKKGKKVIKSIEVAVKYHDTEAGKKLIPRINGVSRVSKLSRRVYLGAGEIKPVLSGKGLLILSTPKGILTGEQARKEKVGGEALFKIW